EGRHSARFVRRRPSPGLWPPSPRTRGEGLEDRIPPRMAYKTLSVDERDGVVTVTLNRPEVHNAFNDELIAEAIELFDGLAHSSARAVVLRGSGANFCAGADLNWMSRMVSYTRDENVRDSAKLAKMY